MSSDTTAIYYTGNYENPLLEHKVQQTHLRNMGNMPLISVSQKPIEFGKNICVGEVGISSQNAWRQLQVGAKAATTKYVCAIEADFIYPKEYFEFQPTIENVFYCAGPVWILFARRNTVKIFYKKPLGSEGAIVVGRQTLIDRIEYILEGMGEWGLAKSTGKILPDLLDPREVVKERFELETPIVSFKTEHNMHRKAPVLHASRCRDLPGIGNSWDLIKEYMS